MARRSLQWINSPVLMEALMRYQEGRLPRSMRLWVEELLELNPRATQESQLLSTHQSVLIDS